MSAHDTHQDRMTPLAGVAYALPVIPVLMLMSTNNVLSGLYASHYGLALTSISMVMLIAGLFDAVTDPTIGYLSDRYHARTGSRRPFVVAGAVLLIPSAWFLLNPEEGVSVVYFLVWYLLFYLAMTLFQIPHLTWGGEITPISEEKNRVYAYRNYALYAGMILFTLIPILPFYEGTKITPETMRYLVIIAAILLLPTLTIMLRHAPTGRHRPDTTKKAENPFSALAALIHNIPALWYVGAALFHALAGAFYLGLAFMVLESYLGLGQYYVYLVLFHLVAATLAIKPSVWVIGQVGKIKSSMFAYAVSLVASALLMVALLNNDYSLALFFIYNAIWAITSALVNVAIFSLLSDISDYGTLKSGVDRSASYFAVSSLIGKTCTAFGIAASIAIASGFGFDPKTETQSPQVYWGLALCMSVLPIVFNLVAIFCLSKISITSARHDVIRRRLDALAFRASQADTDSDKATAEKPQPSLQRLSLQAVHDK
jgi:GPH family glycoside/pentoside/hexuronide:cation symporter